MTKKNMAEVLNRLSKTYENPKPMLAFTTPFELVVATVLSAQCTDVRVNMITRELYAVANTPEDMLKLGVDGVREIIKSCGLSNSKSKNIIGLSQMLLDDFHRQVPQSMEELIKLPGVGRKTANVVLSNAFGIPAIAVDTHVFRVSNRIGLADAKDVLATEKDLMKNIPKEMWSDAHHWLIYHGRKICSARSPKCSSCIISDLCMFPDKNL
ncbi:endonuclease III [Alkalibacter rhizosphaerae]|uniref:endonuclease III n=1 Tax=Alkalibacter rhizosphaerae TaxID=2815577 RepID=UPI0035A8968A